MKISPTISGFQDESLVKVGEGFVVFLESFVGYSPPAISLHAVRV